MTVSLDIAYHDKQWQAFESEATEILYGGAAGGGKSFLMRSAAVVWALQIPGLQVYLFRRIRDDLVKNHMEGPKGLRAMLAPLSAAGVCRIVEDEVRFFNGPNGEIGSKIYLCHVNDSKDIYKYQGAEIHVLLMDEATHFTEEMYRYLRQRVRMVGLTLPQDLGTRFPRIILSANPGNIGHQWVRNTFVDHGEFTVWETPRAEGGMVRQFIPARLEDNPSMLEDDANYEMRLEGLGSTALVEAMRWGNWDVVEGAFFDTLDKRKHQLEPFGIPEHWPRFRSGDWGSAKPFSVGWWAMVPDKYQTSDGHVLPRGAIVRYREWYGVVEEPQLQPDKGLKLTAEDVGEGIRKREEGDPRMGRSVLDPACWAQDGGPSIAARINKSEGVHFLPADNKRVARRGAMGGWDLMRARINGTEDDGPMLYVFKTCRHWWRTVPTLQHDAVNAEDLDTKQEDHAGDDTRYACASRPWLPPVERKRKTDNDSGYRAMEKPQAESNDHHFT